MDRPDSVSVFGLGKMGACFTAVLAASGFSVYGVDPDESVREAIRAGEAPYPEPRLQEYLEDHREGVTVTDRPEDAVRDSEASFVFVNTPLKDGRHSLETVMEVCETIGRGLAGTGGDHTVIIRSTVMPGDTQGPIRERLERISGRTAGDDFGLAYCPEFAAVGELVDGLERPDFAIIGEHDRAAGDVTEQLCSAIHGDTTPIIRMGPKDAELAKMANNTFRTVKISFANMLGELAESIGAEVAPILQSFDADPNIEPRYLVPGAKFGGPCYARDNDAFRTLAEDAGTIAPLAAAAERTNAFHGRWLAEYVADETPADGTVAVLGLAYKPGAYLHTESQAEALVNDLGGRFTLRGYDPLGEDVAAPYFETLRVCSTASSALQGADAAIICTPCDEFEDPDLYEDVTLVDPWRLLDCDALADSVAYRPIGGGQC